MKPIDQLAVNAIRMLSAEAVQKANSGHPGLPMGAAPMAWTLWSKFMKHNPSDPKWPDRDRFILSAGHGSMLIYSLLHLFGYGLTVDDLKNFRQMGSRTPGHPEYGHTVGVETTTGPLGQGIANAVGMAIAEARLAAQFNTPDMTVVDHYTYALCGDGCMMEGISGEASSLAGTLGLGKLILLYDDNEISIEGDTDISFRENVGMRYEAYGWHVQTVECGNDMDEIAKALTAAKAETDKPSLIIIKTQIGFGCPGKQGKASAHGEPLGADNVTATRKNLNWSEDEFYVPKEVYGLTDTLGKTGAANQAAWEAKLKAYKAKYPDLGKAWDVWFGGELPDLTADPGYWEFKASDATRNSSGIALNRIAEKVPNMIGGSADLAPSNKSNMKNTGDFSAEDRTGSNLHFGVREHAMAAICNGIALHGGLRAYGATFFTFADYMKHAMRLSAMMKLPVTYILTHDSIGVGEDGPTHEPIEQLAMLRSIPGMTVYRPADGKETAAAWWYALNAEGPTSLVLTRQNLPLYEGSGMAAMKGAYVLSDCEGTADILLLATGSEVELIMGAQKALADKGVKARVVSMPSWEVFEAQSAEYKESVLPDGVRTRLAVEAASSFGWERYVGLDGYVLSMKGYGASGPAKELFIHFGFTVDNVVDKACALLDQ